MSNLQHWQGLPPSIIRGLIRWLEAFVCGLTFLSEVIMYHVSKTAEYYFTCALCVLAIVSLYNLGYRIRSTCLQRGMSYEDLLFFVPSAMLLGITILEYYDNVVGKHDHSEKSEIRSSKVSKAALILSVIMFVLSVVAPLTSLDEEFCMSWEEKENAKAVVKRGMICGQITFRCCSCCLCCADIESQTSSKICSNSKKLEPSSNDNESQEHEIIAWLEREIQKMSSKQVQIQDIPQNHPFSGLRNESDCSNPLKSTQGDKSHNASKSPQGSVLSEKKLLIVNESEDYQSKEDIPQNPDSTNHFIGLQNTGNSCFLNASLQALWNTKFAKESETFTCVQHFGNPCVVCAVVTIFRRMRRTLELKSSEPVNTSEVRNALHVLDPQKFPKGLYGDAYEVMEKILCCFHMSSVCGVSQLCIVHENLGLYKYVDCKEVSKDVHIGHNIKAFELREMKVKYPKSSFGELIKLLSNEQYEVHTIPTLFLAAIGWADHKSDNDIPGTLLAMSTEINLKDVYAGLESSTTHRLVSLVCFSPGGPHTFCFVYKNKLWTECNDGLVQVVGGWDDVVSRLKDGNFLPHVLVFEEAGGSSPSTSADTFTTSQGRSSISRLD